MSREVDALSREVDALVAEHVMGATWGTPYFIRDGVEVLAFEHPETQRHTATFVLATRGGGKTLFDPWELLPHYTTDIAAAWEVVEKLREEGWLVRVQEKPDDIGWDEGNAMARAYCSLSWMRRETTEGARKAIHEHPRGMADTAPEAICLAALRAKGVDV